MDKTLLSIISICLFFTACHKDQNPAFFPPSLKLNEAKDITRTSAVISGEIQLHGEGKVTTSHFHLATFPQMENAEEIRANTTQGYAETTLSDLTAGETYYYNLVAGNGYSQVESEILHFQTLPNTPPTLASITLINKGPLNATVECNVIEDGGLAPTMLGFCYQTDTDKEARFVLAQPGTRGTFQAKISGLDMKTSYRVYAYAANSIGETHSDTLTFLTDNAIYTTNPGSLSELIGEQDKYRFSRMSIAGKLNGNDLRLIRDMLGQDINGNETPGRLADLDLSDAVIVRGGGSYFASRYTANDTLGYETFANCRYLQRIILPHSLKVIEKNAFANCTALESITIPDSVSEYTPSEGCYQFKEFKVSPFNTHFYSRDGILYDKQQKTLLQYPQGKAAPKFRIPETVIKIADQAFLKCPIDTITMPHTVKTLGAQVFLYAKVQAVFLSNSIRVLPTGTFQGCSELNTVSLGSDMSLIYNFCFEQCPIQDLYLRATYPPVCYSDTFTGTDMFSSCKLHVPQGCKMLYRQAKIWQHFEQITENENK